MVEEHKHCLDCQKIISVDRERCGEHQKQNDIIAYQLFGWEGDYIKELKRKYPKKENL